MPTRALFSIFLYGALAALAGCFYYLSIWTFGGPVPAWAFVAFMGIAGASLRTLELRTFPHGVKWLRTVPASEANTSYLPAASASGVIFAVPVVIGKVAFFDLNGIPLLSQGILPHWLMPAALPEALATYWLAAIAAGVGAVIGLHRRADQRNEFRAILGITYGAAGAFLGLVVGMMGFMLYLGAQERLHLPAMTRLAFFVWFVACFIGGAISGAQHRLSPKFYQRKERSFGEYVTIVRSGIEKIVTVNKAIYRLGLYVFALIIFTSVFGGVAAWLVWGQVRADSLFKFDATNMVVNLGILGLIIFVLVGALQVIGQIIDTLRGNPAPKLPDSYVFGKGRLAVVSEVKKAIRRD